MSESQFTYSSLAFIYTKAYNRAMANSQLKNSIAALLSEADVRINGERSWDLKVTNDRFYDRLVRHGTLGAGESYMAGEWDSDELDVLVTKVMQTNLGELTKKNSRVLREAVKARLFNINRKSKAFEIGQRHYDIGNDLYRAMLDKRLVYTCAYWKDAKTLDEAQEAKLDLVCQKIGLKPGMRVLDIGGGWGSFAKFAAEKYQANVVNISVSKEQVALANELCKGLSVENRLQDYRDVNEKFDRIVSLGMFEHVGYKNYRTYMEMVQRNLKDDGLFLLHTIGGNQSRTTGEPWTLKYIFPNSMLPSIKQIGEAIEGLFVMEDWHNFSADYDKTLMAWHANFEKHWPELKDHYSETFYRMWRFYLLVCAATFRSRTNQLWQIVLSKNGVPGGYQSIR